MDIFRIFRHDRVVEHFYQDGELWYRTRSGLEYPAPREERRHDAAHLAQESLFQRIR